MSEEKKGFWDRLWNLDIRSEREEKVLEYIIHRVGDGAHLADVTQEEYVRRNASPDEVREIVSNPRLVQSARESMEEDFATGGSLDPNIRPPS